MAGKGVRAEGTAYGMAWLIHRDVRQNRGGLVTLRPCRGAGRARRGEAEGSLRGPEDAATKSYFLSFSGPQ